MDPVTKRLHVSGLTPQITSSDLTSRFSLFGTIKAVDGLGKVDAHGAPRPYAYVTLESTKNQLARCVNLLSGTTWKGAKLRIGDAKPDFSVRIANEHAAIKRSNEEEDTENPRKRKRLPRGCQGVHAADMSIVTPENASDRSGWRKTPMGRLIRPVRMRPLRPLPAPLVMKVCKVASNRAKGTKEKKGKKKKMSNLMVTRARRLTIDPMRWGSEYLKGIMLEGNVAGVRIEGEARETEDDVPDASELEDEGYGDAQTMPVDDQQGLESESEDLDEDLPTTSPPLISPQPTEATVSLSARSPQVSPDDTDIAREAVNALDLLNRLFGDRDEEWGGEESISDIDRSDTQVHAVDEGKFDLDNNFEEVPIDHFSPKTKKTKGKKTANPLSDDTMSDSKQSEVKRLPETIPVQSVHMLTLKDMFAPREEDSGFSLLGNLNIDLELDDTLDIPIFTNQSLEPAPPAPTVPASTFSAALPTTHHQITFDPTKPLFFPCTPYARASAVKDRGRAKDIFDAFNDHGWGWEDGFYRTENTEEIRTRWESAKVELTRGWKRRHREAVKSVRRRGGAGGRD